MTDIVRRLPLSLQHRVIEWVLPRAARALVNRWHYREVARVRSEHTQRILTALQAVSPYQQQHYVSDPQRRCSLPNDIAQIEIRVRCGTFTFEVILRSGCVCQQSSVSEDAVILTAATRLWIVRLARATQLLGHMHVTRYRSVTGPPLEAYHFPCYSWTSHEQVADLMCKLQELDVHLYPFDSFEEHQRAEPLIPIIDASIVWM